MPSTRPALLARALLALGLLAPAAAAQIDLPDEPVPAPPKEGGPDLPDAPRGKLAERLTGTDPYREPTAEGEQAKALGGLDLPPQGTPGGAVAVPGAGAPVAPSSLGLRDAAEFILAELRKQDDVLSPLVLQASQSLAGFGIDGLEAARRGLAEDKATVILASARVLLASPAAADRELVRARIRSKLPPSAGGPLVEAFASLDPVAASPAALAGLLDHPQVGVRAAANRRLEGSTDPALLPALLAQLDCGRADTRLRALDLAATFGGAEVIERLIDRLRDPSALVAGRAALLLAAREDDALVGELRRKAFDQPWILRESAYAILSLIEREDARLVACLDDRHVPVLLEGLASSDPFVSGTCAAALAGIGFRSTSVERADWLDRKVPEKLVLCVAGADFHNDFSSIQRPACRRLALITGQSHASDGPAWMRWWGESRATFRARRAVIDAKPELAPSLKLTWRNELEAGDTFLLLGPTAAAPALDPSRPDALEVLRISEVQARDVYAMLSESRAFTAERLPGTRGAGNVPGRSLEIGIGDQGKSFRFAGKSSEPWFDTLETAAHAVRERNRWQRYPSPLKHQRADDLWFEQFAWWDADHTEAERASRLKSLVLGALPAMVPERRGQGIDELAAICADPAQRAPADFEVVATLLRDEKFVSPRTEKLLEVALPHLAPGAHDAARRTETLVVWATESLADRTGEPLARILRAAGPEVQRAATRDPRPKVRAVAVRGILELSHPEDVDVALAMLEDPSIDVQLAVTLALGEKRIEAARAVLLDRARLAQDPAIQAASLAAVASLGGPGAIDAIVLGLASPNPSIKLAAARGLAKVGDPAAAPLLISLLGQGRGSDVFEAARQGLIALGDAATSDLLRAVNTPGHRTRREGAVLLSQLGVPQAVPVLLTLLSEAPNDSLIASELAVITCVDLRPAGDPAVAWWDWWEGVVHDDPGAWLCSALVRLGADTPPPADLAPPGTRAAMRFLAGVLRRSEPHLCERARRDLGRLLGRDLGALPPAGEERLRFCSELEREIAARFPQ